MQVISKIEIQYFRSIYRQTIKDLSALNIITGKNDAGKSNVLKALNLFFNKKTDANTDFDFKNDFNLRRLNEVRKESVKGKQFIQIKVTFITGNNFEKSLPNSFTITKKWFRNDLSDPSYYSDDVEAQMRKEGKKYSDRSKSSLTKFLNNITYLYIPAIKDENTFSFAISQLQECIFDKKLLNDDALQSSLNTIANSVSSSVKEINSEFSKVTGINTSVNPPRNIRMLYHRSLSVFTKYGNDEVEIGKRGDGIRVRYIPSILNYIANSSHGMYIWGFEEPENSLEYGLALNMADTFHKDYSKSSMIFVTTHSPAFIGLEREKNVCVFRCFNNYSEKIIGTEIIKSTDLNKTNIHVPNIEEELGYIKIQKEIYDLYNKSIANQQEQNELIGNLKRIINEYKKPVIITEGKTDVIILKEAWKKLYGEAECPYQIKSCSTTDDSEESNAGCTILEKYLESYRFDSSNIVIGLFDRDEAGKKSYKLNNNYKEEKDKRWKCCKNGKAYAMLLPIPRGKEKFDECNNLTIEFFFEKSDLEKEVNGYKLGLEPQVVYEKCGNVTISNRVATEFHLFKITENKEKFASIVVPTFPKESFVHFTTLFERIKEIVNNKA